MDPLSSICMSATVSPSKSTSTKVTVLVLVKRDAAQANEVEPVEQQGAGCSAYAGADVKDSSYCL